MCPAKVSQTLTPTSPLWQRCRGCDTVRVLLVFPRVPEDLRLPGHQAAGERRVLLPGYYALGGEGDRGQRSGATKHSSVCFACAWLNHLRAVLPHQSPPVSTCPSFSVPVNPFPSSFSLLLYFTHLLPYISTSGLPHIPPAPHPCLQALCSWTRAVRSSSLRVSPSHLLWSSLMAASPTTPQTWRRYTTGSLTRKPTSSSTWWTADRWAEPLRRRK